MYTIIIIKKKNRSYEPREAQQQMADTVHTWPVRKSRHLLSGSSKRKKGEEEEEEKNAG